MGHHEDRRVRKVLWLQVRVVQRNNAALKGLSNLLTHFLLGVDISSLPESAPRYGCRCNSPVPRPCVAARKTGRRVRLEKGCWLINKSPEQERTWTGNEAPQNRKEPSRLLESAGQLAEVCSLAMFRVYMLRELLI